MDGFLNFDQLGISSSFPSPFTYKGLYNASTNTPTLTNGVGSAGDFYYVNVAGSNNPTGANIPVGYFIIYNGSVWQAVPSLFNSSDNIVVAGDYLIINGATIAPGQSLTYALGVLEGQIDVIELQLNPILISATALTKYAVIYQLPGTNTVGYAQANGSPQASALGITQAIALSSTPVNIQTSGNITNSSWTWTPGENVFLSPSIAGGLTQTIPTTSQYMTLIGIAINATTININIIYNGLI